MGENKTNLKLSAMADIGRIEPSDIVEKKDSLLSLIRVACYAHQVVAFYFNSSLLIEPGIYM